MASTEHVWQLHDALGERHRAGLLLAAFARLRLAEVCGLRVGDVDFMRGIVSPVQQCPADQLKTEMSRTPIPIPEALALTLSAHDAEFSAAGWLLTDEWGHELGRGSCSGRSVRPRHRSTGCRPGSGSTTCGTTTPAC